MSPRLVALMFSGTALIATISPAAAIDADSAAEALRAALAGGGDATVSYASASQDGNNIRVEGLAIGDKESKDTLTFAEVVIEAPTEGGIGIFDSPTISFSDGTFSGTTKGSVASAMLTGVSILDPATIEGDAPGQGVLFKTAGATDIRVGPADKPGEVTIASVSMETGNVVDNVPQDSKGMVEDITVPPEAFAEAQFKPETIGYDSLVFDLSWDGSRDPAADTMAIRDFTLSIQDGGDLSISGIMGKLPSPNEMNDPNAGAKAAEMEVHTLTLRYEDNSLAGRVLDFLSKQQGISREEYAQQIAGALPFLLAALNNPEFQNQVAEALGAFLQDPQSLTVTMEPDAPVSGGEIMGLAGTAPQTLPDRLNASISANTAN